jgi:LPS sulfotransferase NodH
MSPWPPGPANAGTDMCRQYFFIVGAPRSGTTMLQQALNRHSRVVIPPETQFLKLFRRTRRGQRRHLQRISEDLHVELPIPRRRLTVGAAGRALFDQIAARYLERAGRGGDILFGEKSPVHQRRLDVLRQLFPDAKIVLIFRDGRDVALSLSQMPWMSKDLYINFAVWVHYWRIQSRAVAGGIGGLLTIRYESLVADPVSELGKVLSFLGLPSEPQVWEGAGNRDGVPAWELAWKGRAQQKIDTMRVGRWRQELDSKQIAILERWGGPALQALGYDLVTGGTQRLPFGFLPLVYARAALWLLLRRDYYLDRSLPGYDEA